MDNPDAILVKTGLRAPNANAKVTVATKPVFCCELCVNDGTRPPSPSADPPLLLERNQKVVTLNCGHEFCADCYTRYVKARVTTESESRVSCMAAKCNVLLPESIILQLSEPAVVTSFRRLQQDNFMRDHEYLKWCPQPKCEQVVECHVPSSQLRRIAPTVLCQCKNTFCFGCGLADHQPAVCMIAKNWLKKCADDSETANWIHVNTKECPKCHSTIEKSGGCNHMICKVVVLISIGNNYIFIA